MDGWKRWLWLTLERALDAVLPMDESEQDTVNIDTAAAKLYCRCSEPGCAFVGPPELFIDHLKATHSWSVDIIDYGKPCQLQLPASKPRCLLVAKEDMRVFVVSVGALGDVSLACLRRTAAVGPHYTCKMWMTGTAAAATGKVTTISVEMEVPSSAVTGEAAATETDFVPALIVQNQTLDGLPMELHLNLIIDKVQT